MKHVVIASPYATVSPHFETELEIAQHHLDCGDRVTFISCFGELENCDFNETRDPDRCHECKLRRQHGFAQLKGRIRSYKFERFMPTEAVDSACTIPQTIHQLKQTKIQEFDIGFASLSSLVSNCRDPQPDLQIHSDLLQKFTQSSSFVYRATQNMIARHRPDCVYVFNGRFAAMRAVLRACQSAGVTCQIHERGCDTRHYQLFENRLPHDIEYMESRITSAWNSADPTTRDQTAAAWFKGRIDRAERNWHSFVKQQRRGLLPSNWNSDRKNLVVFNSSEDEFVAIGDCWSSHLYDDQVSGITQIATDLARRSPATHITVRMHPNLRNVDNATTTQLRELQMPNLTIVQPDDEIDSYQLLLAADAIATFGSSMGIEAVYWEKPSVLLGPSFYMNLGGTYRPENHEQAIAMLSTRLVPQHKTGALMYGFWLQTNGLPFQYFEPTGLFSGTFRGQVIYAKSRPTPGQRFSRKWNRVKKRVAKLSGRSSNDAKRDAA